jgi:hypothetical protein
VHSGTSRIVLLALTAFMFICVLPGLEYIFSRPDPEPALNGTLTEPQKGAIATTNSVSTLLINWSFGVIGFNAWVIRRYSDAQNKLPKIRKIATAVSITSAVGSMFFGQLTMSAVGLLLNADMFSLSNRAIRLPASAQFILLLISVATAAICLIDEVFWPAEQRSAVILGN